MILYWRVSEPARGRIRPRRGRHPLAGEPLLAGAVVGMSRRARLGGRKFVLGAAAVIKPIVPRRLLKAVDDRFFGAVFQVTRVTNDNYDSSTREVPKPDENG